MGGCGWSPEGDLAGSGGAGGGGGVLNKGFDAEVYAYNGNRYTNGTSYNSGENECPIYLQNGIKLAKYSYIARTNQYYSATLNKTTNFEIIDKLGYENEEMLGKSVTIDEDIYDLNTSGTKVYFLKEIDMSTQGVGSGAGYLEISNGTYTIYNEDSNGNFTTIYT